MGNFECLICGGESYVELRNVKMESSIDITLCACAKCNYVFIKKAMHCTVRLKKPFFKKIAASLAAIFCK